MSHYQFAPPAVVTVPVAQSSAAFPVRRIYCVGRNYAAHVREMGGDEREPPFFFQKPRDAIVLSGAAIPYPTYTEDFQYEIELVLAIGERGANVAEKDAAGIVFGLAVGVDLTRRDVQIAARKSGRPWEIGKAFDQSALIGPIHPLGGAALPTSGEISLSVNGETKQKADLSEMIWSSAEVISQLSQQYVLEAGDLIYTGTPAGVGPLKPGDALEGRVAGLGAITCTVVAR